jgi:hypothetical protein
VTGTTPALTADTIPVVTGDGGGFGGAGGLDDEHEMKL